MSVKPDFTMRMQDERETLEVYGWPLPSHSPSVPPGKEIPKTGKTLPERHSKDGKISIDEAGTNGASSDPLQHQGGK